MLPQIGSTELLVIAAIALIVVGPKDLPVLLRKLGRFVGRLRGMANDFRSSFDEMARQSELDELRAEVAAMRDAASAENASIGGQLAQIDHTLTGGEPIVAPQMEPEIERYDPESYLRYPESPTEKIINRRRKVAQEEGSAAKPKPRKTTVKVVASTEPTPAPAKKAAAPRKAAPKARKGEA